MIAPGLKITNFHYSNMTMPKGTLTEYPKWIHMTGYPSAIVQTAEEETVLRARPPKETQHAELVQKLAQPVVTTPAPAEGASILAGPNDERELLFKIAEEKSIKVDRRWKTDRLRNVIAKATENL